MHYATIRIYQISFILTFTSAIIMLSSNMEQMSRVRTVEAKAEVCTGVLQTKKDWKKYLPVNLQTIWNKIIGIQSSVSVVWNNTQKKITEQFENSVKNVKTTEPVKSFESSKVIFRNGWNDPYKILVDAWINKNLAKEIVNVCNSMAKYPSHCMKYASSVSSAESWWWKKCYNNNCFWIKSWSVWFKTLNDWVIDWVNRYNKYWWKATSMSQFYAKKWELPYFRYCTSEISSNSSIGCPNWLKHSQNVFNKLDNLN